MPKLAMNLDEARIKAAAADLKNSPDVIGDLAKDPKAFMNRFGVEIDDATAAALKQRLSGAAAGAAAGVIHIDL